MNSIVIDNRLTITDLKIKICEYLDISPGDIIMRRGGRAGNEIKEGKKQCISG